MNSPFTIEDLDSLAVLTKQAAGEQQKIGNVIMSARYHELWVKVVDLRECEKAAKEE